MLALSPQVIIKKIIKNQIDFLSTVNSVEN